MVAVPRAPNAFGPDGRLIDTKAEQKLTEAVRDFVTHVANHHPLRVAIRVDA